MIAVGSRLEKPDPSQFSPPLTSVLTQSSSIPSSASDTPGSASSPIKIDQDDDIDDRKHKKPIKKSARRLKMDDDDEL